MSVEALSWALNTTDVTTPTGKLVLIALANHARPDGSAAFPSVDTICRYTCLSERTVRTHLDVLEQTGVIRRADPAIVAAYIKRHDRRPVGFDLCISGVRQMHPDLSRGAGGSTHGVQLTTERGATVAPEPYKEPSKKEPSIFMSAVATADAESPTMTQAAALCELLADLIVENGAKRPNVTARWKRDMEALLRIDGRSVEQVENAIRWCQSNPFWRANILSPSKLREKYEQLRLQARRDRESVRLEPRGFTGIREFLGGDDEA